MSGDRRRVGLLVPSSNTVMEPDLFTRLPQDTTLHTARMFMEETTPEGEARMLDEFCIPAAEALGTARPDIAVFGCTSAGALRGNTYDRELCERLSVVIGCPTLSVIKAVSDAIAARGATTVGVLTPYVPELTEKIRESLEHDGMTVTHAAGLNYSENFAIASVTADEIVGLAANEFADIEMDILFVSCTNFRAYAAAASIEQRLSVPVLTSNMAAFEALSGALTRSQ